MSSPSHNGNTFRVLIVDDTPGIHDDIRKVLASTPKPSLQSLEDEVFSTKDESVAPPVTHFEIDSAYQGEEGVKRVREALAAGKPYALAFIDMRMPPGIDGCETIS